MNDEPLPDCAPANPADGGTGRPPVWCRVCGRPLTGRASRRTGLGPACDAKLHPDRPDVRARRHEVEQDRLF
ncbi:MULTISPECIES: DUF6011 domain-containing protein [Streptomyces]|jgi:hypothetical protein|uniref:Uncharacterized protein n=3 Tax=Streptomyces TaxID=1883 RepID=A0A1D8FX32_9ACTN|nr:MULTISPECIES: DUF6011 domain-containing protein [Streptomyces]AOT57706.1 hypothetical protein A4G23_00496 [Streptomyces rubrolavendulae]OSY50303.1 hypothetical protein BG846_04056 [Streptomyces fradiae ATCC 10745 = DSM 40063]UQS32993.1 hypothetical protein J5J01_19755 [Streptomyces fradiae]WOI60473.1 DUF6011 domain-containing protein [Streptomyces fradiae]